MACRIIKPYKTGSACNKNRCAIGFITMRKVKQMSIKLRTVFKTSVYFLKTYTYILKVYYDKNA